jgi:exopolysaccharide biosynthesis WecB/TagA/CpsF family protein
MVKLCENRLPHHRPWILTSANGEVVSYCASNSYVASLFAEADIISADGQPMVAFSKLLCRQPLPERVATTDLFHDVAALASDHELSFYMLGSTEEENREAVARVQQQYPKLNIVGRSHGYLAGDELRAKVEEINRLKPNILWLALGVPYEQRFCVEFGDKLTNVDVIKTSGGLFNFLSGTRPRAPALLQRFGLEWAYRAWLEPKRLGMRYLTTNPHALVLLGTRSY